MGQRQADTRPRPTPTPTPTLLLFLSNTGNGSRRQARGDANERPPSSHIITCLHVEKKKCCTVCDDIYLLCLSYRYHTSTYLWSLLPVGAIYTAVPRYPLVLSWAKSRQDEQKVLVLESCSNQNTNMFLFLGLYARMSTTIYIRVETLW